MAMKATTLTVFSVIIIFSSFFEAIFSGFGMNRRRFFSTRSEPLILADNVRENDGTPLESYIAGNQMIRSGILNEITDVDIFDNNDDIYTMRHIDDSSIQIVGVKMGGEVPRGYHATDHAEKNNKNNEKAPVTTEASPETTTQKITTSTTVATKRTTPPRMITKVTTDRTTMGHEEGDQGEQAGEDDGDGDDHQGEGAKAPPVHFPNITRFFERLAATGYDPRVRPYVHVRPIRVTCSMFITTISQISESNMDYTVDFYFRQIWNDFRLRWDRAHDEKVAGAHVDEGITVYGEFFNALWRPDTFFVNEKTSSFHTVTGLNSFIRIMPNGCVTQSIRLTIRASCQMTFHYFPLDHQKCPLYIESYSLPASELRFKWINAEKAPVNRDAVGFGTESTSLLHFVMHGFRTIDTWDVHEDGYNHSRLIFDIYLERNLGYYLIQIYIPASLIVVISWISFWIPRNSAPARVSLGVTTVLTMVTFTSMGAKAGLPNISYLKAMDIFMLASFVMVFFALLEYAVVSYIEKQSKNTPAARLAKLTAGSSEALSSSLDSSLGNSRGRRQTINIIIDDESMTFFCGISPLLPSRIEWFSRFSFPISFVTFNTVYWYYYLFDREDEREEEEGFVSLL